MKNLPQIVFSLAVIAAFVWASARILQKAGYPGWLAVLFLIPVVNVLAFIWFAATEWPVEAELRRLRVVSPGASLAAGSSEEEAWGCYQEAIGLEVAGRVAEALATYQQVIDTFPNTAASQDAQKAIDALRKKLA